jgi:hypothetical protein
MPDRILLTLERKFAAWLKGKVDREACRGCAPPRWIKESPALERFYLSGLAPALGTAQARVEVFSLLLLY